MRPVAVHNRYLVVARSWAVVFLGTGLIFLVAPGAVGAFLTRCGHWLGLVGQIASPSGGMWYVLALSLMVCITGLAWLSASRPEADGPFWILLAAKLTSTVGFLALSSRQETVWLLAAGGDGFVALTLWVSRRGMNNAG